MFIEIKSLLKAKRDAKESRQRKRLDYAKRYLKEVRHGNQTRI